MKCSDFEDKKKHKIVESIVLYQLKLQKLFGKECKYIYAKQANSFLNTRSFCKCQTV
jgi:hypothetical protein